MALALAGCRGAGHAALPDGPPPAEPASPTPPGGRLSPDVVPRSYTCSLSVDPSAARFSGVMDLEIDIVRPTQSWVLHAEELLIRTVNASQGGKALRAHAWPRPPRAKGETPDEVVIIFGETAAPGPAHVRLTYEGESRTAGFGLVRARQGGAALAFTHFEPAAARRVFPCFDEPGKKARFDLQVTTTTGNVVVSNMPLEHETASEDGRHRTFDFAPSPPLPPYLFAFAVGPIGFLGVPGAEPPTRIAQVALGPAASAVAARTARTQLAAAQKFLGVGLPFPKLDLLAVPRLPFGLAMEHPGLVTVEERYLLVDASSPTWLAQEHERVVAHEIAHMWFGNLVTPRWWNDLWLNEGLASWAEGKIAGRASGQYAGEARASLHQHLTMLRDQAPRGRTVRRPVEQGTKAAGSFDEFTYVKGMTVIRMTERWVGEDVLLRGLRRYLEQHAWDAATTADLAAALEQSSGQPVGEVFASFIDQVGVPEVSARVDCQKRPRLVLQAKPYTALGTAPGTGNWTLPVCARRDGAAPAVCTVVRDGKGELDLPGKGCPRFVLPNASDAGYFRWTLPETELERLVRAQGELTAAERVGLLGNLQALVESGELPAERFLGWLQPFARGDVPELWAVIIGALISVERWTSAELRPALARYVAELLSPAARRLGWQHAPGDSRARRLTRTLVLPALGTLGRDVWAAEQARALADRWLAGTPGVHVDLVAAAAEVSALSADQAFFERLWATVRQGPTPAEQELAVTALARIESPALVEELCRRFGTLPDWAGRRLLGLVFARARARDRYLEWIGAHGGELDPALEAVSKEQTQVTTRVTAIARVQAPSAERFLRSRSAAKE